MECWKDIKGYEGLYQVSNLGRIRKDNKIINPWVQFGYKIVGLWKNNKYQKLRVHRLVAEAFINIDRRNAKHCEIKECKLDLI